MTNKTFEPELKQLKHNETIDLGNDAVFTYIKPSFEDAMMVFNHYENAIAKSKKSESEEIDLLLAITTLKTDAKAMEYLYKCVNRCLLDNLNIKDAKEIDKNVKHMSGIVNQVLLSIIATFGDFTKAQNGE